MSDRRRAVDIAADFDRIVQTMCPDGELTPEAEAAFDAIAGEWVDKVQAFQIIAMRMKADEEGAREAKRLLVEQCDRKIKAHEGNRRRLAELCGHAHRVANMPETKTALGTARWQRGADLIEVMDEQVFCATYAGVQLQLQDGRTVEVVETSTKPKLRLLGELHRAGIDISGLGVRAVPAEPLFRLR